MKSFFYVVAWEFFSRILDHYYEVLLAEALVQTIDFTLYFFYDCNVYGCVLTMRLKTERFKRNVISQRLNIKQILRIF